MDAGARPDSHMVTIHGLARRALFGFVLTFIAARTLVFLIMSRSIPNFYFFLRGTHVHHLNYGIFLLAGVGGYLLLRRPSGREADWAAYAYGFAMALTFDEFGMWLHLGGSYWQRVSVDAVVVVAAVLGILGFARSLQRLERRHFWAFVVLILALAGFAAVLFETGSRVGEVVGPKLIELEQASSP